MSPVTQSPLELARAYHDHWRAGRTSLAAELLADTVAIETPINAYPHKADFVAALAGFGAVVADAANFVEFANGNDVVQVYDMAVQGVGVIRIAEHFVFTEGKISRLRQIHDTMALRAAGFDREMSTNAN